jgi:ketosteroid isomerase-like protein
MTGEQFAAWLRAYGVAWASGDAAAAGALFAQDAEYHAEPWAAPARGRAAIEALWAAGAGRTHRDVEYDATVVAVHDATGVAHWHATFTQVPEERRVELDGVLVATFGDDGRCAVLREWWHRREV